MERNTVERVTEWDSEPFNGGYAGLRDLASGEFTGAVTEGSAWLFMLNGRVLGVFDGELSRFEDADGTAYTAPDRSLPLLFAMQETGGDVRGEYYSEETPMSEVDRTLKSGGFTGYVELSENVLSGDYYLVYYGGRRLPVAFVGNQSRRISGDEAFERADDEVGIYRVRTVALDITDIPEPEPEPEPEPSTAVGASTETTETAGTDEAGATDDEPTTARDRDSGQADVTPTEATATESSTTATTETPTEPSTTATERAASTGTAESEDERTEPSTAEPEAVDTEPITGRSTTTERTSAPESSERDSTPEPETESEPESDSEPTGTQASTTEERASAAEERASRAEQQASTTVDVEGPQQRQATGNGGPAAATAGGSASQFEAESDWQGTTTIPALDPSESVSMADEHDEGAATETADAAAGTAAAADTADAAAEQRAPPAEVRELREERDHLRERVDELEAETERLGGERDRLERERDEATATVEELERELDDLRSTVDHLESELETAEADLAAAEEYVPEGDHEVAPEAAIEGTSLFVRYEREGGPTLTDAHDGDADREAVNDNLRLERHTEFDDAGAVVEGEPFDEWLRGTIEYGFIEWLTGSFVHDVRETRNQTALGKLFDALPEVDRVEFRGSIDLGEAADGESATFDVVLRDRMGQPLVVTDLNGSRDPATEPMLESLLRNATPVGESNDRLSAAFFVTSSYYEPGALETAEEATGGGFLGRGKHKSFVKLSRKDGYHLCLVETRDGEFHVSLPEL